MADKDKFADEMLSDDELDDVNGGSCYEAADDSRFLNVLLAGTKYHQCDRYGATKLWFNIGLGISSESDDIKKSWATLGIRVNIYGGTERKNQYYNSDGKEISQAEAWAHAESLVGKHLTKAQWNW